MGTVVTHFVSDVDSGIAGLRAYRQAAKASMDGVKEDARRVNESLRSGLEPLRGMVAGLGAAAGIGGFGMAIKGCVELGAKMEDTRISFGTMLGDMQKGDQVIKDLMDFSVVTPFEPGEILPAGRTLLAFGEDARTLIPTLNKLGDISSGTEKPLGDLARIYGKVMATGKIQGEELNQLNEAGIPIVNLLAQKYGVTGAAIYKAGEQGTLGFRQLQEVMDMLTQKGGMFHGMMEARSKTLSGVWSTLVGLMKEGGTGVGAGIGEPLKQAINELIVEMDKLKASGAFAEWGKQAGAAVKTTISTLKELAAWVAAHQESLMTLGLSLAGYKILVTMVSGLKTLHAAYIALSAGLEAYTAARKMANAAEESAAVRSMHTSLGVATKATGALSGAMTVLGGAVAAVGVAWAGWELGKTIADLTGLRDVLADVYLKMAGVKELTDEQEARKYYEANVQGKAKDPGSFEAFDQKRKDHAALNAQKAAAVPAPGSAEPQLGSSSSPADAPPDKISQLIEVERDYRAASGSGTGVPPVDPSATGRAATARASALNDNFAPENMAKAEGLLGELSGLDVEGAEAAQKAALDKYERGLETTRARLVQLKQQRAIIAREAQAKIPGADSKLKRVDFEIANAEYDRTPAVELTKAKTRIEELKKKRAELSTELAAISKTGAKGGGDNPFDAAKKAEEETNKKKLEDQAKKIEAERKQLQERSTKIKSDMAFDSFKDGLTDKIKNWKDKIDELKDKIAATKSKIESFGGSMEHGVLKSKEEIKQDKDDAKLKRKVERHNEGKSVTFTKEEQARIDAMEAERRQALGDEGRALSFEDSSAGTEKKIDKAEQLRSAKLRGGELSEIQQKLGVTAQAAGQIDLYRKGNTDVVTALKNLNELLDKRLPGAA